jgi:elongation factor Ts
MGEISASMVKELREMTGAGMMDCKKALNEAGGSLEAAVEVLRKKGLKDIGKRAGRTAAEGTIGTYIHANSQIVAVVELNCETDFVARGDDFQECARGIAMHVAAMKPLYLSPDEVPSAVIEKEREIFLEQLTPAQRNNAEKILPGKLAKFYEENCLLEQPYVRDDSGKVSVKNVVEELSVKCGEKVSVRRFVRFEVGEGIEKQKADLASDVAALTGEV